MSLSSQFNEALHAMQEVLRRETAPDSHLGKAAARLASFAPVERPRREREPSPYPYPDLEPSQRAFRVARRNKAIEIAEAVERKQKRNDLVSRFKR